MISRFFTALWALGLALSLACGPAWSAPLKEKLTFAQFKSLVTEKVAEVPELQTLWEMPPSVSGKTYFTGGALRGLLLWLYDELQTHSVEEVRYLRVPRVETLLLQKNADRDLLAPGPVKQELEAGSYRDWDVLDYEFMKQSVADGGATLDRLAASPKGFRDPYDALRSFYDGKLVFVERKVGKLGGNTPMALALRYLRFAKEFERALKPTAASLAALRRIGPAAKLPLNHREEIHDEDSVRYWVKKALGKFIKAYEETPEEGFLALKRFGLLEPLGKRNYYSGGVPLLQAPAFAKRLAALGLNAQEIAWATRMAAGRMSREGFQKAARDYAQARTEEGKRKIVRDFLDPISTIDLDGRSHNGRWQAVYNFCMVDREQDAAWKKAIFHEIAFDHLQRASRPFIEYESLLLHAHGVMVPGGRHGAWLEQVQTAVIELLDRGLIRRNAPLADHELYHLLTVYERWEDRLGDAPRLDSRRIRALLRDEFPRRKRSTLGQFLRQRLTAADAWQPESSARLRSFARLVAENDPARIPEILDVVKPLLDLLPGESTWRMVPTHIRLAAEVFGAVADATPETRRFARLLAKRTAEARLPAELSQPIRDALTRVEACGRPFRKLAANARKQAQP